MVGLDDAHLAALPDLRVLSATSTGCDYLPLRVSAGARNSGHVRGGLLHRGGCRPHPGEHPRPAPLDCVVRCSGAGRAVGPHRVTTTPNRRNGIGQLRIRSHRHGGGTPGRCT